MAEFNFNINNFGLGVGVGWATAYAAYRARHILGAARDSVSQRASIAQEYASRSADARYLRDLTAFCQTSHLAGSAINLTDIVVEPRFITLSELAAPVDDDIRHDVFHVVPKIHDHPYLHAPYNIETLAIDELDNGDTALALLGLPGSGRTIALQTIALWSLGAVRFDSSVDAIQRRMEEEEASIDNDKERADRIKERLKMQQLALDSLERKRGKVVDETESKRTARTTLLKQLTPIYVHLGNINVSRREFGRRIDPGEPLVRAVQYYCGRVTAKTLPRNIYERLKEGKALLLIDGFDDLPTSMRAEKLAWIRALIDQYRNNFIIVAGPATGYGDLVSAGLAPVFLRPWHDVHVGSYTDKWLNNWSKIRKATVKGNVEPDERTIQRIKSRSRAQTPFELTAKIWSLFADSTQTEYEEWFRNLISRYLGSESLGVVLPHLALAAKLQIEEGLITADRLEQLELGISATKQSISSDEPYAPNPFGEELEDLEEDLNFLNELENVDLGGEEDLFDDESAAKSISPIQTSESDSQTTEDSKAKKVYANLLQKLHRSGLLTRYRGGAYQFRHPMVAAYFASLALKDMSPEQRLEKAFDQNWHEAVGFASIHTSIDNIIDARLESPPDMLQNYLLETTRWLAYASKGVEWRATILRQLGNLFVAPNQYPVSRERIAAALLSARDKGATRVFEAGLRHPNSDVRKLSCLGVGALQAENAVGNLSQLLNDPVPDVKLSAALALGAIGDDDALEEMIVALTQGEENVRQAVAEAFAAIPEEGYPVLYDAINHQDMMLRRAAVFGLRRINTPWALISLYRTSLEDDQWYVRSAAEGAFADMQYGDTAHGPRRYPSPESIPWLREWLEKLGDGAAQNVQNPEQLLQKALEEGDADVQTLAALNMGQLGIIRDVGLLYTALRHHNGQVRSAAYHALSELQMKMGQPLPSPI